MMLNQNNNKLGKLIVFEGIEGAGKTTQIEYLKCWLEQFDQFRERVVMTKEPGGTLIGQTLRTLLLDQSVESIGGRTELLLYAADRCHHVEHFLKPHLNDGKVILCDRFIYSTIAYQGYGRGISLDLIEGLNEIATGGVESDLVLWLDLPVEVGLKRVKARGLTNRIEEADLAFHYGVQRGFEELYYQSDKDMMIRIDANRDLEAIQSDIQAILVDYLKIDLGG